MATATSTVISDEIGAPLKDILEAELACIGETIACNAENLRAGCPIDDVRGAVRHAEAGLALWDLIESGAQPRVVDRQAIAETLQAIVEKNDDCIQTHRERLREAEGEGDDGGLRVAREDLAGVLREREVCERALAALDGLDTCQRCGAAVTVTDEADHCPRCERIAPVDDIVTVAKNAAEEAIVTVAKNAAEEARKGCSEHQRTADVVSRLHARGPLRAGDA